jgi:clan AA aspartic protease (TIGR02281 family)
MLIMRRFASLLIALLATAPASAQVRVLIDGRMQDVPAGVVRTVSYEPGGHQIVHDEPFAGGATMPGAATVTTTETTDEDDRGNAIRTTVVTRIEPMAAAAYAPPPGYAMQPAMQGNMVATGPIQPAIYTAPPQTAFDDAAAPHLDTDAEVLDTPAAADSRPQVVHIKRDPMTGHFIASIRINGVAIRAIVDTGAQTTVLSARDAQATGADRDVTRTEAMAGIGGYSMLRVTHVRSMDVGGQALGGCTASIGQEGIPYTLLGQTEIARLGRIVIENGEMTITPRALEIAAR